MSIEEYNWGDPDLECHYDNDGLLWVGDYLSSDNISFNKQDAIAIAKHFDVDRESLVLKIKELINVINYDFGKVEGFRDLTDLEMFLIESNGRLKKEMDG